NQEGVTITVFQGESDVARDSANRLLGEFDLKGIRPARRGEPQIEVTFSLDKNGVLQVKAKDLDTQKEAHIEIKGSSGLDSSEVERMRKEAESHAGENKKKLELADARNEADTMVYQIEKVLSDAGDKVGASEKSAVQGAVERVKQAMAGQDVQALKQATSDLKVAAQGLAQYMQGGPQRGGPSPSGDGHPHGGGKPDDVIDAEFEEKK